MTDAEMTKDELLDALAWSLYRLRHGLHRAYANTSRHGKGIGGQAMTTQCLVIDPETANDEDLLMEIDEVLNYKPVTDRIIGRING